MNSQKYIEAVSGSLYHKGNSSRLKKALEKKDVKLAFVGGSITKGWDGKGYLEENYTNHVMKHMSEKYPDKNFTASNLSTESANSFIGLSITSKVIDEILPDIVFLEYAVNNECGHDHIVSYESLVKRMLSLPSSPAVVLVFLINKSLYTSQGYMKRIGTHYSLSSVSVADSMKIMLEEGFDWAEYSDDVIHPNLWGHRFIADCVINALDISADSENEEQYTIPAPLYSLEYSDYLSVNAASDKIQTEGFESVECSDYGEYFSKGISSLKGSKGAKVKFEGEFKNLFAAFVHDKTEKFSDADIYIDGEKKGVLQGKSIYGWGNVTLRNIHSFDSKGHHSVELRVKDAKKDFTLIEFGIS